jgi:hypothetical protein
VHPTCTWRAALTGICGGGDAEQTERLDRVSAPTPNDYPNGPFVVKQRDRYVGSSDQAIGELF